MEESFGDNKEMNLKAIFATLPSNSMLVDVDPPKFTILLASDNYLKVSGKSRNDLIGKGVFEVFPANSSDKDDTGSVNIRASFEFVIKNKKPHSLDVQRYDVADENGIYKTRYWVVTNNPVLDDQGNIIHILHSPEEITAKILVKERELTEETENRFRQLANSLPLVVWTASPDGNLTFISNQWEEVYGNPIKESLGTGWINYVHPEDVKDASAKWAHALKLGELYETEFRVEHKDGTYHWILVRAIPILNEEGEIISWNGSNTDIQEKKSREEAFTESEARFKVLADNIPNLAWMADHEGWIFWYNNRWYEYTGTTPKEMEGWGWQSVHDPEKLPSVLEKWQASIDTGKEFEMVFPLKGADGKFRDFLTRVIPIYDKYGKIFRWLGTNTDITPQRLAEKAIKESEQNLRNVILQAPVAMCLFKEPNFRVALANGKMFELWGKKAEDVMHKPILEGLPEIKGQGFDLLLENVYRTGDTYLANDVIVKLHRNGKIEDVYVDFVYEAYREADGTISGILAVAMEVTEQFMARQKIEEVVAERTKELAESNHNLQKTNEELAQFAYIASHDLQEPLRKISIFSQMLENTLSDKLDEQSRNYLNKINSSSARMTSLIKDVLSYSELGKVNAGFESVNLNEVIENAKTDYDLLIEQKGATINFKDLPVLEAIPIQMSQLFSNLLSNALKFTKKEVKPLITISSRKLSKEDVSTANLDKSLTYFEIKFSDNGIGFEKEYAHQIFSIFQRLHRKSEYEGTGIGLAMCKKIALNHHGDINANESSKNGAVFKIILPEKQVAN